MTPMPSPPDRRRFVLGAAVLGAAAAVVGPRLATGTTTRPPGEDFPLQDPAQVREMVGVAHGNAERVRELLALRPDLAKAAIDWGFGDWESALGAASHTGNREIALLLLAHGARPTLFSAAMLGHLAVVRATVEAHPGAQRIAGPHGISLLDHARAGGDAATAVVAYLEGLGDAGGEPEAPLAEAVRERLTGSYRAAELPAPLTVTVEKDRLLLAVAGASVRRLVHRGDRVFHPAGASGVRVTFSGGDDGDGRGGGGGGRRLTIVDGDRRLEATAID